MPSIVTIAGMLISFFLLAHAQTLLLSIAYPVWTGIMRLERSLLGLFYLGTKFLRLRGDL